MQPNMVTGNRTQLGQYQARQNYGYDVPTNAYRPNQRGVSNSSMVHQNTTMGCVPNSYSGVVPNLYSNLMSANICNISDTVQILQPIPIATSVTFRTLPFYKFKYEILKPSAMNPNHQLTLPPNGKTNTTQEFQFAFVMTCAMASELSLHRDITKNEYTVQAQLRITAVDLSNVSCPTEYDDFLPMGLVVRVNNRPCVPLPPCGPCARPNQEARRIPRPISVTHLIKISPMNTNVLAVNWAPEAGKQFVITMNVVEKLSSEFLLNTLKEKPKISVDLTKFTIRQQYRPIDDVDETSVGRVIDDEDIATTIVRVSLVCPLAKIRMQYPAKGKYCTHLQCFDGSAYISLNEKKPMWNCPVCHKALHYDDLLLDEYFMNVLRNDDLLADCQEVQLFVDGTWKSYVEDSSTDKNASDTKKSNSSPDRRPTNSPDENAKGKVSSTSESVVEGISSHNDVVNLLSDDEDDPPSVKISEEAPGANKTSDGTNERVSTAKTPRTVAKETDALNVGFDNSSKDGTNMEIDGEVVDTSFAGATDLTTRRKSMDHNQIAGIISLDSPSPPTSLASPVHPPVADLNIHNN